MNRSEKYLASLLPNFEEKRIVAALNETRKDYLETIIPAYDRTAKAFVANKLKMVANTEEQAKAHAPRYKGDMIATIHSVIVKVPEKITLCEDLVKDHFSTYVTKEGMTFARANVLRFTEVLNFGAMYARRLLLAMYASTASKQIDLDDKLQERELQWLRTNAEGFFRSLKIIDMPVKDIERKFKSIPHLSMIEGRVEAVEETMGPSKVDPLQLNLLPHQLNPIFHIRVLWENFQEKRRLAAIEEMRQMELLLIILSDDKVTPAVKREIQSSRDRLAKAQRTVRRMEEDADDEA